MFFLGVDRVRQEVNQKDILKGVYNKIRHVRAMQRSLLQVVMFSTVPSSNYKKQVMKLEQVLQHEIRMWATLQKSSRGGGSSTSSSLLWCCPLGSSHNKPLLYCQTKPCKGLDGCTCSALPVPWTLGTCRRPNRQRCRDCGISDTSDSSERCDKAQRKWHRAQALM